MASVGDRKSGFGRSVLACGIPVALGLIGLYLNQEVDALALYFISGVVLWIAIALGGFIGAVTASAARFRTAVEGATFTLGATALFLVVQWNWAGFPTMVLVVVGIPSAAIGAALGVLFRHLYEQAVAEQSARRSAAAAGVATEPGGPRLASIFVGVVVAIILVLAFSSQGSP